MTIIDADVQSPTLDCFDLPDRKHTTRPIDFKQRALMTTVAVLCIHESSIAWADAPGRRLTASHVFSKPGIYYSVLRATSQRKDVAGTRWARVQNLARVRVVVK
jgi:hypothetical protein